MGPDATQHDPPAVHLDTWLWPLLHTHAPLREVPLCPGLRAFHAEDELPLWQAVEHTVGEPTEAPFYAVAWPGAQAIARAMQDGLVDVRGLRVLDLGCGGGLVAIAAAAGGATQVTAIDVDPLALSTTRALASSHRVHVDTRALGLELNGKQRVEDTALAPLLLNTDLLCVADLVYSRALGKALCRTLRFLQVHQPSTITLIADSGRPYFAETVRGPCALNPLARHEVAVPRSLDGADVRRVSVYTLPH